MPELTSPGEASRTAVTPVRFTWPRLMGDTFLVVAVFLASSIVAVMVFAFVDTLVHESTALEDGAAFDRLLGFADSLAIIASTIACWPVIRWLARKRTGDAWSFLALRRVSARALLACCLLVAAIMGLETALALWLDIPAPETMIQMYAASSSRVLLFIALVFAAPLIEEAFFRGYLFGALRELGMSAPAVAVVTAALFASLHLDYDAFYLGCMFVVGLALAWARVRYDSLVPCIVMHTFNNVVAFGLLAMTSS